MLCRERKDRTTPAMVDSSVGEESYSSSDASNSTPSWKYDVFLSFRGKDTRLKFTDHLYEAFKTSGIITFRDDTYLERGGDIQQDLPQAIEDSLCAVVIISGNYADSAWCLDELQNILESASALNRRVFPIFYDVDPADVRKQRNSFGKAMAEHEKKFGRNTTKVGKWRDALSVIANLSGWDTRGKHEADLIKNIVGKVWTYLCSKLPSYGDNLVGIDSRVSDMMPLLEIGLDDKRFVGIWGMGGLGKTTLARVVSEKISRKFEICCFLAKVRETLLERDGLVSLQKSLLSHLKIKDMEIHDDYEGMKMIRKLLCNKKVLLVLDDLDDMIQLKNLAESLDWFGRGSKIIFTTRERHLLTASGVQRIYEMKCMKEDESLKLFSNKAFKKDDPEEDYLELSKSVVQYAGGLPLALQAMGSYLCGRSEKAVWRDALEKLKQTNPHRNILEVLKISYDGLDEKEQTIFLDVVCFFKCWKKEVVIQILKGCDLNPIIGIKVLIEKTLLVEREGCRLDMHDLYEDLGRDLIQKKYPNSRLWKFEDIKEVLENNKGSDAIQAIVMRSCLESWGEIKVHPEAFLKMSNIRLLLIDPDESYYNPFILPRGFKLSGALKVVRWKSFPLKALPLEIPLDKLVHIEMHYSEIKQLWNGRQFMRKLKHIDLSYSLNLATTPDFSETPYLEHLCLCCCKYLVKVHPSLGKLTKLVEVDLYGCKGLEILPTKLETYSLMKLDLHRCKKLAVLPEFGEGMKKLSYLNVSYTAITILPESLGYLTGLRLLALSENIKLKCLKALKTEIGRPIRGWKLSSLTELYLNKCGLNDGSISNDFLSLPSLIVLDLSGNSFVNLTTGCFSSLSRLLFLSLAACPWLKSLPRLPPRLVQLNALYSESIETLSSDGDHLWDLIASLDYEHRGRVKYVISGDEEECDDDTGPWVPNAIKSSQVGGVVPLWDFCALFTGSKIPSWFPNKEYHPQYKDRGRRVYVIEVEIPPNLSDSEWSGIVVCFPIISFGTRLDISWSTKAAEDDDNYYLYKQWAHYTGSMLGGIGGILFMMVLELNKKTCWQRLGGPNDNNSLHIKLSISTEYDGVHGELTMRGCGWRLICKEEIQRERCYNNHNNDLKQLTTQPQVDDEVKLPVGLLDSFMMRPLMQDTEGQMEKNG